MEIRDIVHGAIWVNREELPIIDSRFFQRLRQIKQLGFAEHSFPSATHNRYIHSLGAMHTASQAFENIFSNLEAGPSLEKVQRFRALVRLAGLLHDVGHGPLSHTTEFAMPSVGSLGLIAGTRKATHEDYTLKIILDSELTPLLDQVGANHGFKAAHVASLIDPDHTPRDDFFDEYLVNGERVCFHPLLQQIISSEIDADRMDYLRRDSTSAGVSYGNFDFNWLISNLTGHCVDGKCYLALRHRALFSFEDFLISRFHMFLMVYFHYKSVIYDAMLGEYFSSPLCDYQIPSDIEKYIDFDDYHLYSHLAKSKDAWAERITRKRPYRILVELHSGIPTSEQAATEQRLLLKEIEDRLKSEKTHYLSVTSTSELSKYFRKEATPIFVRYDNLYSRSSMIPLHECTDLFERYREKRTINRIYVSPEDYRKLKPKF